MKSLLTIAIITFSTSVAFAQGTTDEAEIKMVIDKLFTAMQKGDSIMMKECFAPEVSLATIYRTKTGDPAIFRESSITKFAKAVQAPHKEIWYEEYWNLKVNVDGDFASAWCDYAFYLDKTFSHCGVDAFHFHKSAQGWKIFHLADTRRKTGCTIPDDIQKKHQ
jgi:hypothetical protein